MSALVILVGNPRPGSRTHAVALRVGEVLRAAIPGLDEPRVIDLAEHVAISFTAEPARPGRPAPDALDAVRTADLLLVATPSYKGTFTGLLKVFLDQFGHNALASVVAVPVAVAGAPAHVTATEDSTATLLRELGATVPDSLGVLESTIADSDVIERDAAALAPLVAKALENAR